MGEQFDENKPIEPDVNSVSSKLPKSAMLKGKKKQIKNAQALSNVEDFDLENLKKSK